MVSFSCCCGNRTTSRTETSLSAQAAETYLDSPLLLFRLSSSLHPAMVKPKNADTPGSLKYYPARRVLKETHEWQDEQSCARHAFTSQIKSVKHLALLGQLESVIRNVLPQVPSQLWRMLSPCTGSTHTEPQAPDPRGNRARRPAEAYQACAAARFSPSTREPQKHTRGDKLAQKPEPSRKSDNPGRRAETG